VNAKRWGIILMGAILVAVGCGKSEPGEQARKDENGASKPSPPAEVKEGAHSGWWCKEHGIPEADCSMCLSDEEVQKRFKDKGDWCEKHNRAKSQCFICDPKLKDKFAALYREKYGKEPPPIKEEKE
jgi:hypothetical protein